MPAFDLTILLTKSYCAVLRSRSNENDGTQSPENKNKLIRRGVKIIEELKKLKKKDCLRKKKADANLITTFKFIRASFFSFSGE